LALISCPECGNDVSDKAKACPNCGCPVNEKNGSDSKDAVSDVWEKQGCIGKFAIPIGCLIPIILFGYAIYGISQLEIDDDAYSPNWVGAANACAQFVEQRLHTPGTAEYPWGFGNYSDYVEPVDEKGKYDVVGHVDAQNQMGAKVRHDIYCRVEEGEDREWHLHEIEIYE